MVKVLAHPDGFNGWSIITLYWYKVLVTQVHLPNIHLNKQAMFTIGAVLVHENHSNALITERMGK